jgi:AraC-like DNA-binding protein
MTVTTLLDAAGLAVVDYKCEARRGERPFAEYHARYSLSYVRRGSFGCSTVAGAFELVPGSVLLGHPGDEYVCAHAHAEGDECLSIQLDAELASSLKAPGRIWRKGCVQPLPELVVLGGLLQAAARGESELGLDEAALSFAGRFVELASGSQQSAVEKVGVERRRAVQAALFIEEHSHEALSLEAVAKQARCSHFHFLRLFAAVVGVTPHQYLLRCRLRRAAELLADDAQPITDIALAVGFNDLSNFVRTFRRASGVSPRAFRQASKGDRSAIGTRLTELVQVR